MQIEEDDNKNIVDDDFEVEVVADPEDEKPEAAVKTEAEDAQAAGDDEDDDLESYGEKVKKRISKEVWKRREAERQAQAAQAQLNRLNQQLQTTQRRAASADDWAIKSQEEAIEADYLQTQQAYKKAYDEGDTDAMFAATEKLADIRLRKRQVEGWKAQRSQQPQQRPVQQPAPPQADPRAVDWASKNTWFGKDPIKTGAAYALDAELKSKGVDPRSDAYYEELDRRLGEAFPDIRKSPPKQRPVPSQPVAGVNTRPTSGEKRKVTLTASEADMANRLGVPLAEYARYLKRA